MNLEKLTDEEQAVLCFLAGAQLINSDTDISIYAAIKADKDEIDDAIGSLITKKYLVAIEDENSEESEEAYLYAISPAFFGKAIVQHQGWSN